MKNNELIIQLGNEIAIENGGDSIRQFPFLSAFNNTILVNFSQHGDTYIDHPIDGLRLSSDFGNTWPVYMDNTDFYFTSIVRLENNDLFGMSYITTRIDEKHSTCYYCISSDNGINWRNFTGTVVFPEAQSSLAGSNWGGIMFHRTLMQMSDGSLRGTMYGRYTDDKRYCCLWVKSEDRGASWSIVSVIAFDCAIGTEGYCEPVVARCADGSLLCVMRTGSSEYPLYQCRSLDEGLTWTVPEILPGVNPDDALSVDPDLCLMSNGVLILSYGRPGCRLLFSPDGNGSRWGHVTTVYTSTTSGYTGIREISPGRLLVIGDKGSDWLHPAEFGIWGRYIDVRRSVD